MKEFFCVSCAKFRPIDTLARKCLGRKWCAACNEARIRNTRNRRAIPAQAA